MLPEPRRILPASCQLESGAGRLACTMFFFKLFRGARATAAWSSLAGAVSLGAWVVADHVARRSLGPWVRGGWFALGLIVALVAGVAAFPRWQALVGIATAVGAILLLIR